MKEKKNNKLLKPCIPGPAPPETPQKALPHPQATNQDSNKQHLHAIIFAPWPVGAHTHALSDAESAVAGRTPFGCEQLGPVPPLSAFPGAGPLQCTQQGVIMAPCFLMAHGGLVLVQEEEVEEEEEEEEARAEWGQEVGQDGEGNLEVVFGSPKMDPGRDLRAGLAAAASSSQLAVWPDCELWLRTPGCSRPDWWSLGRW